ncbi:rhodanese-like domain-containing protein [Arcobacter sp.]|uniref:rhodanese-like domain-containing protein n=1 Tax=Arcobacter sp. TaxID=1872629 RepID=UPI003D13E1F6
MKIKIMISALLLAVTSLTASEFIGYKGLTKELKAEAKKNGTFATAADVKEALKSKDWLVADVRTMEEWAGAHIPGSVRIGRQAPEKALALHVLDENNKFIKPNIIIVCNTASRAAIEAMSIKKLGFENVKIYGIEYWIDDCNPVETGYSSKSNKHGTKNKFGAFLAEHCYKK